MVKKGLTDLLGGITKALTIPPEDDEEVDVLRVTSGGSLEVFDKAKARLFEIQTSPQTYCTEPDGPQEQFDTWRSTFDLEAKKGEISDLLVSVNETAAYYSMCYEHAYYSMCYEHAYYSMCYEHAYYSMCYEHAYYSMYYEHAYYSMCYEHAYYSMCYEHAYYSMCYEHAYYSMCYEHAYYSMCYEHAYYIVIVSVRLSCAQVPSAVSHADFWERYFYRVYQLNQDELRKSDLKKRADQLKIENSEQDWEDDWESEEPQSELSSRAQPEVVANLEPTLSAAAASPVEQAAAIPISSNGTLSSPTTTADTESLSAAVASDDDKETHQGTPSVNIPTSVLVDPSAPLVADSLPLDSKPQSVETTPTTNDVETTPVSSAVETTPVTSAVETTPVTSDVEKTPATSAEETTPTTSDVKTTPVTSAVETTSVTSAVETTPVTSAVETTHKHEMEEDLELMNQSDVQPSPQNSVTTPETEAVSSNSKKEHEEVRNLTAQEKTESDTLTDSVDKVDLVSIDEGGKKVAVKEKGDFLMVGSDRPTPASSVGSTKSSGLDDDWDKDLFGEDLKAVQELAEQISAGKEDINLDDDWESWE
ncbi:BSDC1 [Bugula neritina]|uniref:BSDC1 n=1 Tax=Bugula neritina TaxID=10212 RepID=A0A7J7KKX4_BUGNE|nr:BSDC1 [Bugula neritina]